MRAVLLKSRAKGAKRTLVLVADFEESKDIYEKGGVDKLVMEHTPGTAGSWALRHYKRGELKTKDRLFIVLSGYGYEMEQVCESLRKGGYTLRITKSTAFFTKIRPQEALETVLSMIK